MLGKPAAVDGICFLLALGPSSGTAAFSMGRASYHRGVFTALVQREGAGALFGGGGCGRGPDVAGTGWTKDECIQYLLLRWYGATNKGFFPRSMATSH